MMKQGTIFKRGDVVVHAGMPEWGDGVVDQVGAIMHEGRPAQRLVVKFDNHGRVTINTGVARLWAKEGVPAMSGTRSKATTGVTKSNPSNADSGWLSALERPKDSKEELWRLPDDATDPFVSLGARLKNTLRAFRFGNDPHHSRNILDWAVVQTGLSDPMTRYNRHELEHAYPRYLRDCNEHLKQLVKQIKRQGRQDLLEEALRETTDSAARGRLKLAIRD